MDNAEALQLLQEEMDRWRSESWAELADRVSSDVSAFARSAPSGREYQLEIQCVWDDRPGGSVRVIGSIDDGGWRAFVPLTVSFAKSADGSFVGE
jgi:hypothetical protein